jgi:hypothetical protein
MDPNVFDKYYARNPDDAALNLDVAMTTSVIKMLYGIKGGDSLYQDKNNKDRLVEIDRYYIAKYKAEIRVLKTFIFFCCLALIGSIFYNKGMITMLFFTIYTGLLFLVMFIVIARDLINIFLRDSTNFDEYDYSFFYKPKQSGVMYKTYNAGELSKIPTCAA